MDIRKLLKPNKICIVGANEKEGFGGDTCRNVMKYMATDKYFFVNPKRESVFGVKAYKSVLEVPEKFELVVICTPSSSVEGILKDSALMGAKGAVVYASGYKEVGTEEGVQAQQSLRNLCEELDIALMGPNCAGFVNYVDMVYPFAFISDDRERRGNIGFASQSGQLCLSLMDSPSAKFSYSISAGNCAVAEMEDYIDFLVDDEDTKVVAVYIEGVKNPEKLASALKKAAMKRKPVVMLKAGRSEKGEKIAASHTGSLSGADKVFDALVKKFGVVRVNDLEELLYTSQLFATINELPKGSRFASMNLSGGETGICADVASLFNVDFPDFEEKTLEALRELLPSYASPANPLDMTATLSYNTEAYANALRTVMKDENIDMVLVGYTLLQEIADPAIKYMAGAMEIVAKEDGAKPMAMIPFTGNTRNQEYSDMLEKIGIPILPPTVYAFRILRYLADFVEYDYTKYNLDIAIPKVNSSTERFSLSEHEAKELIKKTGIYVPEEGVAKTEEEAVELAGKIGYPVVMKIDSKDILHKSDVGCVKLNIAGEEDVKKAFNEIIKNAKENCDGAVIGGVLIQKMAKIGTEIIIGVKKDPQFGPAVLVGMGGIFVEVFKDTSLRLAPLSRYEAEEMINSLKGSKLLKGYRGKAHCDIDALVDTIMKVSDFACNMKDELLELDLNPIFVYEKGVCSVDAVIITNSPLN